jgi:Delta24-sterol reductase
MLKPGEEYKDWEMYVDVGIWNVPKAKNFDGRSSIRRMEQWALEHRTYQTLYADTYMSREEFWRMFSGDLYHKLRKQYKAEGVFMDVYDKVCRQVTYK